MAARLLLLFLVVVYRSVISVDYISEETKYATKDTTNETLVCEVCACDYEWTSNPYIIKCEDLQLEKIPDWDAFLVNTDQVNNVHLKFGNNYLTVVGQLKESSAVNSILLESNVVTGIEPFAFAYLHGLKFLSLSNNQLSDIHPNAFSPLLKEHVSALEVLDLSYNQIYHLDADVFDELSNLVELNLAGNPFGFLDPQSTMAINVLGSLTRLDLSRAGLAELPEHLIDTVERVQDFNLEFNRFKTVPSVLRNADNLFRLILDGNHIVRLDGDSFKGMQSLRVLSIAHLEQLETIGTGTFSYLINLEVLKCHHNYRLSTIHEQAFSSHRHSGPKQLKLEMSSNNLTHLNERLFRNIDTTLFDVRNNSLYCDCDLAWIQTKISKNYANETKCQFPVALRGQAVASLDFKNEPRVTCRATTAEKMKNFVLSIPPISQGLGIGLLVSVCLLIIVIVIIGSLLIRKSSNLSCRKPRAMLKTPSNKVTSITSTKTNVEYTQLYEFHNDVYDSELWD